LAYPSRGNKKHTTPKKSNEIFLKKNLLSALFLSGGVEIKKIIIIFNLGPTLRRFRKKSIKGVSYHHKQFYKQRDET